MSETNPDMREAVARALRDTFSPDDGWRAWQLAADAALLALAPHLDAIRAQARREALEEAALICDAIVDAIVDDGFAETAARLQRALDAPRPETRSDVVAQVSRHARQRL